MDERELQPHSEYPSHDSWLPLDLKPTAGLNSKPEQSLQVLKQVKSSSLEDTEVARFRQQLQLVSMLDRLFVVMRLTNQNKETKLAELAELDRQIRCFLEVVIGEIARSDKLSYIPVALGNR